MVKKFLNYTAAKIVTGVVSLFSIWLFARIFEKSEYGLYSYYLALFTTILSIVFSWIRLSSFRLYNQRFNIKKKYNNYYINYVTSLTFFLFFICTIIVIIYSYTLEHSERIWVFLAYFSTATWIFVEQIFSNYRMANESNKFRNASIKFPVYKLFFILVLVYIFDAGIHSLFLGQTVGSLIIIVTYIFYLKRIFNYKYQYIYLHKNKNTNKQFLNYGLPVSVAIAFSLIISNSDRIIIKNYLGEQAVADYVFPYDIAVFFIGNLFIILNFTFVNSIYKSIDEKKISETKEIFNNYFYVILLIMIPAVYFILFFAPNIVSLILGDKYYNHLAINIIRLMALAAFLSTLKSYFFDMSFQVYKKTYLQLIPLFIGAITNIILSLLWVKKYELIGTVIATIIAYAIALICSIILSRYSFKIEIVWKTHIFLIFQLTFVFIILYKVIGIKYDFSTLNNFILFLLIYLLIVVINLKKLKKIFSKEG